MDKRSALTWFRKTTFFKYYDNFKRQNHNQPFTEMMKNILFFVPASLLFILLNSCGSDLPDDYYEPTERYEVDTVAVIELIHEITSNSRETIKNYHLQLDSLNAMGIVVKEDRFKIFSASLDAQQLPNNQAQVNYLENLVDLNNKYGSIFDSIQYKIDQEILYIKKLHEVQDWIRNQGSIDQERQYEVVHRFDSLARALNH